MALYDNKYWLLSHIRNSFISTDDTGMCELIMAGEESLRKQLKQRYDSYPDEEDSEDEDDLSHESYDLQLDIDFNVHPSRHEKPDQAKKKITKMKQIKWETNKTALTTEQLDDMFVRKDPERKEPKESRFSKTFQQYRTMPVNPFMSFSKFDGSGHVNIRVKKFRIFLTMLPEYQRNYPLPVCCVSSATIQELIGLILLKCSTTYEEHSWKAVTNYGLYLVEDDGEVDRDFPCFNTSENIARFGFPCLGLVEHHDPGKSVSFGKSETIPIRNSPDENIERKSRELSKIDQEKQQNTDLHLLDVHKRTMEAPLYKSYQISMFNKMRSKVDVHLAISAEKIEIDPVQKNTKFALVKQKPINHDMAMIAGCGAMDSKGNKLVFKLVYSTGNGSGESASSSISAERTNFKSCEFEAEKSTAEEIIHKINQILELRFSDVRKEYLAAAERKLYKKGYK